MFRRMLQSTVRIQYASDLHLEHYEKMAFPMILTPAAKILCLAGDIGNPTKNLYARFLDYCHDKWEHIFVIAGNHEFYNRRPLSTLQKYNAKEIETWDSRLEACRSVCSQWENVHFLEKDSVHLPALNLTVLGTTMWSPIPLSKEGVVTYTMNDYKFIAKGHPVIDIEAISPKDVTVWHMEAKRWLESKIHETEENRQHTLVMTHHMPSVRFIHPQYLDDEVNCAFAAPMDKLLESPVRAWIYGHTHDQRVTRIEHDDPPNPEKAVICAVNAYGYNASQQRGYRRDAVIDIPCGAWQEEKHLLA